MPVETLEDVAPYRVGEGEEHLVEAHLIGLRRRLPGNQLQRRGFHSHHVS